MIRLALDVVGAMGTRVPVSATDWHYLTQVMRRDSGDSIEVLCRDGLVFEAILLDGQQLEIRGAVAHVRKPGRHITLYQALLKGDHFSAVVERATEAGISRFVPLVTERSIVRDVSPNRASRWRAIAKEASEQCQRPDVPLVEDMMRLTDLAATSGCDAFVLDPRARDARPWLLPSEAPLELVIGPEGGFTPTELNLLSARGFLPLSLGERVYRAENAGAFAAVLFLQ
jgi:16S rRNA (uracil1498-N3)-methyltransferase